MTSLIDNFDTQYLRAISKLKPNKAPKQIQVYVESEDDIAFWRQILKNYENNDIQFVIQLPSNTSLDKGKSKALARSNNVFSLIPVTNLGEYLIICIDSDYDYLLENHSSYSNIINSCDYIFQTYSYSTENLKCYSKSLRSMCVLATLNDDYIIDYEELLKVYSTITYDLFLWNLHFYNVGDFTTFTLSNFCDTIKILEEPKIDDFGKQSFDILKNRIANKIIELETNHPDYKQNIKELGLILNKNGLSPENSYLFIQGHTVFDNVVLMFLKSVCKSLIKKHEIKIKSLAKHNQEIATNINFYHNHLKKNRIEFLLANNYEFKDCFLFEKIHSDVDKYMNKIMSA